MLGYFACFLMFADFFQTYSKYFSEIPSNCQIVWIYKGFNTIKNPNLKINKTFWRCDFSEILEEISHTRFYWEWGWTLAPEVLLVLSWFGSYTVLTRRVVELDILVRDPSNSCIQQAYTHICAPSIVSNIVQLESVCKRRKFEPLSCCL